MPTRRGFPFSDGLQPETREVEGSGVLSTDQMDGVGLVFQLFEAHADVLTVLPAKGSVGVVVELFGDEDALIMWRHEETK